MVSTDTDTLALFLDGFFALAALGIVLAVVAVRVLLVGARRPAPATVAALPHRPAHPETHAA